jgi:hypothetical protein
MVGAFESPTAVSTADGLDKSALVALNAVRTRAAVNVAAIQDTITNSNFVKRLRSERQVEMAFEDMRYWDVRRWMIADQAIGGKLKGMAIVKNGTAFTYTPKVVENRTWEDKMYLYPIPQSEINKSSALVQNPGW